jgi:hypothetical protein
MRIRTYAAISLFVVAGAVGSYFAYTKWWIPLGKENDARRQLPFVSITDRLPKGKPITPNKPLDAEAAKRWQEMDKLIDDGNRERTELLKALHEKTRRFFVESPGEGSGRGFPFLEEAIMLDDWGVPDEKKRVQPGPHADFPASAGEVLTSVQPDSELHSFHQLGVQSFLYYGNSFGYVKDRQHVSGFKPHGFRFLYADLREGKKWRVDHVLLVGILTQEHPVVYLTDKLPSMEQIRQDKVRPLDFFEEAGMPSLREGEDLYIVRKGDTVRMLGALRATKTCQKCHDAEVGDLLGAFSYTLRAAPKAKDSDR